MGKFPSNCPNFPPNTQISWEWPPIFPTFSTNVLGYVQKRKGFITKKYTDGSLQGHILWLFHCHNFMKSISVDLSHKLVIMQTCHSLWSQNCLSLEERLAEENFGPFALILKGCWEKLPVNQLERNEPNTAKKQFCYAQNCYTKTVPISLI